MQAQYIKPYPICRWAHAPIDGVREVMQDNAISHGDIEAIHINTFHESACLFQGAPDTTSMAQYSLSFAVAAQAVHGQIGLGQVSGAGLNDQDVLRMIDRITVAESDIHNASFPAARDADVVVTLKSGQRFESGLVHARGGTERPMSENEIIAKFHEFADPVLGQQRADALCEAVLGLDGEGASLADLMPHLYAPVWSVN